MNLLNAIVPVIATLLVGVVLRLRNMISAEGIDGLQSLVVNVTLPVVLFSNFYKTSLTSNEAIMPLIMFLAVGLTLAAGKMICKKTKKDAAVLPFLISGYEAGMLGFALASLLDDNITSFAMLDIGHDFAIFTIYIAMLKAANGGKQKFTDSLIGIFKTPVLIAILLGVLLGVSGIGAKIAATNCGELIDNVCSFISAPTSAVILVVVGYRMNFKSVNWSKVLKVSALRAALSAAAALIIVGLFKLVGGNLDTKIAIQSAVLMFILPPPFILPLYEKDEEDKEFCASAISFYTLISIVAFAFLAAFATAA